VPGKLLNLRLQLRQQPPAVKLANILVSLQAAYGQTGEAGIEVLAMGDQDLADLSGITAEEAHKIMAKLVEKGWLAQDPARAMLMIKAPKQLAYLAGRL